MRFAPTLLLLLALGCGQGSSDGGATASGGTAAAGAAAGGSGGTAGSPSSSAGSGVTAGADSIAGTAAGGGVAAAGSAAGGSDGLGGGAGLSGAGAGGSSGGASGSGGSGGAVEKPEGVPADYQLVIDESFQDAASLAKLRFADPDDWVHQDTDGGYIESTGSTYAPPYASMHALAIFYQQKLGAFVLDAEVMQTNPSGGHRDFCFAWGMESPSRYYYAHIAEAHDAVSHNIHIVLDADRTAITDTYTPGFDWGTQVWHKIRVTRTDAGDMAVYGDDFTAPLLTASDTRLGSGYIGFGSFDDKGRVRNVKVWAPSAEQAPAAFFSAK